LKESEVGSPTGNSTVAFLTFVSGIVNRPTAKRSPFLTMKRVMSSVPPVNAVPLTVPYAWCTRHHCGYRGRAAFAKRSGRSIRRAPHCHIPLATAPHTPTAAPAFGVSLKPHLGYTTRSGAPSWSGVMSGVSLCAFGRMPNTAASGKAQCLV
jgi:hypothetical protein